MEERKAITRRVVGSLFDPGWIQARPERFEQLVDNATNALRYVHCFLAMFNVVLMFTFYKAFDRTQSSVSLLRTFLFRFHF